jgi:hypothetical protein
MMACKNILIVLALAPLAFSAKVAPHTMALSVAKEDVTHPKMALSVAKENVEHPKTMALSVAKANTEDAATVWGKVVYSSEEDQKARMEVMSKSMTTSRAIEILQTSKMLNSSNLAQVTGLLTSKQNLRTNKNDGFGGLDGARLMLNDMIYEVMVKYDAEIAKCTDYYAQQCALMEAARSQISAANYVAATARALILDAQYNIDKCDILIPETQTELKDHNTQCKSELKKMNAKMKIIMGDIAVITMILEMSDCDKKFLQMQKLAMLKCKDECTNKDVVSFNHQSLQKEVDQLKSPEAKDFMAATFADMFEGADAEGQVELVQVEGSEYMDTVNKTLKTKLAKPPLVRTEVPQNPCTDPNQGAPATSKRGAKCTLKKSPQCYKLQGRFLQIQGEIADARDELLEQIANLESTCEDTKKTLEAAIANDGDLKSSSQTKLATATEKESSAGETGRQVAKENNQYNADLVKQMTTCTANYQGFEEEMCALKKIRGDLFKKMKPGHPGFFQDCEVTKWAPEECSKKCAGGTQKLSRGVLTHPDGGCKCLPLGAMRKCQRQPCPINCVLASWGGWSKCSSKCGGGMATRVRDVKMPAKHGGKQCGSTSEAKQCNVDACEKDCELDSWTKWTSCSKDCDGGSKRKERMIKEPAQGSGKCADKWDPTRLLYEPCNVHSCKVANPNKSMKCNTSMDVVLVVDGTPKGGEDNFALELKAANTLVDAWTGKGITAKPGFALIHYSGPRTWSGVSKCTGKSTAKVDMVKTCKITLVQHFTDDIPAFKGKLDGLTFVPGCKLLSLGLMTVQAEFALGNKMHRTVVVVFVDGAPLSFRKTLIASKAIRKKARLVWVAITKFSPLKSLKLWASRRWQENLVALKSGKEWALPETSTHVIANICPKKFPKLELRPVKKTR